MFPAAVMEIKFEDNVIGIELDVFEHSRDTIVIGLCRFQVKIGPIFEINYNCSKTGRKTKKKKFRSCKPVPAVLGTLRAHNATLI